MQLVLHDMRPSLNKERSEERWEGKGRGKRGRGREGGRKLRKPWGKRKKEKKKIVNIK